MTPPPTSPAPRRMLWPLLLFPLLGFVLAGAFYFTSPRTDPNAPRAAFTPRPAAARLDVNYPAPDFALPSLDAGTVRLGDYRGRVTFVNFWQTWCVPCQREMPAFREYIGQPNAPAAVLTVAIDEPADAVRAFLTEYGGEGVPVALDDNGTARDAFGVMQLPTTFVIDGDGVIRFVKYGEITRADMDGYVAALE